MPEAKDEPEEKEETAEEENTPSDYECEYYAMTFTRKIIQEKKEVMERLLEEAKEEENWRMMKKYEATVAYMQNFIDQAEKDIAELRNAVE